MFSFLPLIFQQLKLEYVFDNNSRFTHSHVLKQHFTSLCIFIISFQGVDWPIYGETSVINKNSKNLQLCCTKGFLYDF